MASTDLPLVVRETKLYWLSTAKPQSVMKIEICDIYII